MNIKNEHCMQCGTVMEMRQLEGRQRAVCPACDWIHYRHMKVGAGVVIEQDERLLLLQRNISPWEGHWNVPAGYAEFDEEPTETAVRETYEETGLRIVVTGLLAAYFFDNDPRGNGLLLLYAADVIGGTLRTDSESVAAGYFGRDELPDEIAGGGHIQVIAAWKAGKLKRDG